MVSGRRHDVCDGPRDLHVDRMATSLPLRHACMRNGALCRARLPGWAHAAAKLEGEKAPET